MENKSQGICIYADKFSLFFLGVACLVFVIMAGFAGIVAMVKGKLNAIIGGSVVAGIAFFGFGLVYAVRSLLRWKPLLVINSEGILDNTSPLGVGMMKWGEIDKVLPYEVMGAQYIGIIPKDIKVILSRQGVPRKLVISINRLLFKVPIFISGNLLPISISDLLSQVNKYKLSQ